MTLITPQEISDIIKAKYPQAQVKIIDKGIVPGTPALRRSTIRTHLFGSLVELNYGENLIILLDGHVVDALKHVPLLWPNTIKEAVELWMNDIQRYLSHHDLPLVKRLAEKYLGKEENIKRETRALYVFYDKFFIVVTPFAVFLFLKVTRRLVYFKNFKNESELEEFFKLAVEYANSIRKGEIK